MHTVFWLKNLKGINHSVDLGEDGRVIFTLNVEAALVTNCSTTRRHNAEEFDLKHHHRESFKTLNVVRMYLKKTGWGGVDWMHLA
jgi:hypothetical protein